MSDETFNTADVDEVLQEEDEYSAPIPDVPVCVKNTVFTKELPSILGPCKNYIIPAGGPPQRILDRNERRKRATIEIQNGDICVGGTPGEAGGGDLYVGAVWSGGLSVPRHYSFESELWARGVNVDVAGTEIALGDSTDAVLVSVTEEFWTR